MAAFNRTVLYKTEQELIKKYMSDNFDYDELRYTTLDFRGAAVATKEQVDELAVELINSLNNLQLIYGGVSAIGIAIGFLMLNTGTISLKNTTTMLRISLIENMICAFGIWCLGYRISMDSIGGLIGTGLDFDIFNTVDDKHAIHYIVLFACAQFTSAITTGALAERTYVDTQIAFKVMLNVLIFPIIASWVWGGGWLSKYGYQDFGGSGFHIVGGTCGLVGANFLGPRLGLFNDSLPIAENKIRERMEKKEHQIQGFYNEQSNMTQMLRELVLKYHNLPDKRELCDQQMIEQTVSEIYRKVFFNSNMVDISYQRQSRMRAATKYYDADQQDLFNMSGPEQRRRSNSEDSHHYNQKTTKKSMQQHASKSKGAAGAKGGVNERHKKQRNKKLEGHQREDRQTNSSDSEQSSSIMEELYLEMEAGEAMTSYYKNLSSERKAVIKSIINLDCKARQLVAKIREEQIRMNKLREKYVSVFRGRNPDLRHFKIDQIKDYTDLLIKEAQNLRQPNSMILVAGGVLFIFFGTFSLSILITRVFYEQYQITGKTSDTYLPQARNLLEVGFDSMIDKLASVSGSVVAVLLLKPLIYGHWRTQEQTSCVYNVETISSSIIAGIASVAGASGNIEIHSAIIIGALGGLVYLLSSLLLNRYQLDDPLQATQTHLFCGLWGVIAFGLVHNEKGLLTTGNGAFLGIQLLGCFVIWAFSFVLTYAFFRLVTKRFHLRLSKVEEVLGLDCQEDEMRMQTVIKSYLNDQNRENMARLTLIQLVRTGTHVSKKNKRLTFYQNYHQSHNEFELANNFQKSNVRRQNNIWKQSRSKVSMQLNSNPNQQVQGQAPSQQQHAPPSKQYSQNKLR